MATPARRAVHFDFSSPLYSDADTSTDSIVSTSSLQYINGQLVAHGFAPSPGLCLDGISNSNMDRTVKCLLDLLGQRIKDMTRTEELSTELRTLRYDFERLSSMHHSAQEKSANLEREMNAHKSRLAAVDRKRQSAETAHKHTTAELQRTRGSLQALRTAHQTEIKKKEKDMEKFVEKWQRLADLQAKLMNTPSGMYCANSAVVEGSEILGKGQGFLEVALEQAERARSELSTENLELRKLVLMAVNETQAVLSDAKKILVGKSDEQTPFTLTTLFPLVPVGHASEKLNNVLSALKNSLSFLMPVNSIPQPSAPSSDGELEKLQSVIDELNKQLGEAQKQASIQATETQEVLNQCLSDKRLKTGFDAADVSVDLMTTTARDEERDRLDLLRKQLDEERENFTQASIKLGQERALMEAERLRLKDEKRQWEVEKMLAELPPTPDAASSSKLSSPKKKSPKKSPKKADLTRKSPSPKAVKVGKAGEGKRLRSVVLSSPSKRVEPSYETEFIPSGPPNLALRPLTSSILPTSFALPPPSPRTSLPSQTALVMSSAFPDLVSLPPLPEPTPVTASSSAFSTPQSQTVIRRPFQASKPFASHMIHAYSPAKPSPLSRILMLGNSPNLSDEVGLDPLVEMDEEAEAKNISAHEMFPELPSIEEKDEQMTLAQELGVTESPPESPARPESPLKDRKAETNRKLAKTAKGRVIHSSERAKGRVVSAPTGTHRGPSKPLEKENSRKTNSSTVAAPGKEKRAAVVKPSKPMAGSSTAESKAGSASVKLSIGPSSTGPRRVLVGSAEAPQRTRTKT